MRCKDCNIKHKPSYHLVDKIKRQGYPTNTKYYSEAHAEASNQEKKKYPKGYKELKAFDARIAQGEMIGGHTSQGKVTISKKVPSHLRSEVYFHEKKELIDEKRLERKHSKGKRK